METGAKAFAIHLLKFGLEIFDDDQNVVSLISLYRVLRKFLLSGDDGRVDQRKVLKLLISMLIHIWSSDDDPQVGGRGCQFEEGEVLLELVRLLQLWSSLPNGSPMEDVQDAAWIGKVAWNVALQTDSLAAKESLYGVAASCLVEEDSARLCCRTLQLAVIFRGRLAGDESNAEKVPSLIAECDDLCRAGVAEVGDRTMTVLNVYKALDGLISRDGEKVARVVQDVIARGDPNLALAVAAAISKVGVETHLRRPLVASALSASMATSLLPCCLDILQETLEESRPEIRTVEDCVKWILAVNKEQRDGYDGDCQSYVLRVVTSMWNRALEMELKSERGKVPGDDTVNTVKRLRELSQALLPAVPNHQSYLSDKMGS